MKSEQMPLQRMLVLISTLAAAWLLWSGLYKPLLLALGAISCLLCFWLVRRMGYFEGELFGLRFSLRLFRYWLWLGREIIRSSLEVARAVLHPKLLISPCVIDLKADSEHPFDQVVLANSITLTPGTLTLDVYEGVIKVHTLTEAGAQDLMAGEMKRRVAGIREA
jgi:multicomponent Na+:H+ antiporter subunit E